MLEDGGADPGVPGTPGFVGAEVGLEDDDPVARDDAIESLRHGSPAPAQGPVHQDEVGIAGACCQGG